MRKLFFGRSGATILRRPAAAQSPRRTSQGNRRGRDRETALAGSTRRGTADAAVRGAVQLEDSREAIWA
jgi:hypothetical protein